MTAVEVTEGTLTSNEWDEALEQFSAATFFHQHSWPQLVRDVYDGTPFYLSATGPDGVCGLLPMMMRNVAVTGRVAISLPLADEAGVLAHSPAVAQALVAAAREIAQAERARYIELRQRDELTGGIDADLTRFGLQLALPDTHEALWTGFKATVRNQVRKAQKSGLAAAVEEDCHTAIDESFYPIYSENTRDLGSPMHSKAFFHEVFDRYHASAHVAVVRDGATPVGAAVALRWRDTLAVPWAASLRRHFPKCPNNLLYWELLRFAIEAGCRRFDFGRSPLNSGTFRFKRQWGAEPEQLRYYRIPIVGAVNTEDKRDGRAYRAFSAMWRKTPLPVARVLGPRIFARLPI